MLIQHTRRTRTCLVCTMVLVSWVGRVAAAQPTTQAFPDAHASDPEKLGWMVGSPPPPDRILRFDDGSYFRFPALRWSVSHFRQLMPTVNVSRGTGPVVPLPRALRDDIDDLTFVPWGSDRPMSWKASLQANYTDGIVVLHQGKVVYERYFGVLKPEGQHGAMSVTKSFVGTLAAMLVAQGQLDPARRVDEYVPELAASAFGSATVRQLMDMTTGIRFSEDYADPNAEVWAHAAAGNPLPKPQGYRGPRSYYEFLQTVKPQGVHGEAFGYRTANTDALGWVVARVSGQSVADLLSERIWRRMGAEQDAYMSVDSTGTPFAGGGLNTGLRDLARFGELIRNHGERYFGVLKPEGQHGAMSVTKSFVGTLAAMLVAQGQLDPARRVDEYVPELAASAFGSATVRQLMDMTTGIRFSEDYADPNAEVWAHAAAGNPLPKPQGYRGPRSYYEFLQTVKPQGVHGEAFGYRTANTDALGWVVARVSGQSVADLLSERIWRRMGAEQDAYMSVDSTGTPFAGGGLNTGLRDLARFGELIRNHGVVQGQQLIPAEAIADIRRGGSPAAFAKAGYGLLKGWTYRDMWWVTHNAHGAFAARGVHGQVLYIDPKAEMVIARFASHPVAGNAANDPTSLPAYHALALHLMKAAAGHASQASTPPSTMSETPAY